MYVDSHTVAGTVLKSPHADKIIGYLAKVFKLFKTKYWFILKLTFCRFTRLFGVEQFFLKYLHII